MEQLCKWRGRSWNDVSFLRSSKDKQYPLEKKIYFDIKAETLPAEDAHIYSSHYFSREIFYLACCPKCLNLMKPTILEEHVATCNKTLVKKIVPSPKKKRRAKRSNKSTSEEDSESVISSKTDSPASDSLEGRMSDSCVVSNRDDTVIDVISVEEIPSGDSKPPTPGPQDLYEEFTAPYSERSHGTSLLEAHLLSNTKYNTSSGISSVDILKNKYVHSTSILEQAILKTVDITDHSDPLKSISSAKSKTETKCSIPISKLPQNVKITSSGRKLSSALRTVPSKANLQKLVDSKGKTGCVRPPSPFDIVVESVGSVPPPAVKEKPAARSRKNKRSKGRNRSSKNTDFDPDKHCGVLLDENRHCMRSLTCKTHSMSLRRSVAGRSKEFDRLLAEHRASKEALKDPAHQKNILPDPCVCLSKVDNLAGKTIKIQTRNRSPEVVRVRLSNLSSSCSENRKSKTEAELPKIKSPEGFIQTLLSNGNSQPKASIQKEGTKVPLYNNKLKISFVCSSMLYKVGGLLCTDRIREAVRKSVAPLVSKVGVQKATSSRPAHPRRRITEILQSVKKGVHLPIKVSLREQNPDVSAGPNHESESRLKSSHETEHNMRNLLSMSGRVLGTLSTDENELRKLRLSRHKRSADRGKICNGKRARLDSITDENYDINTLLSFDKSGNDFSPYPSVASDEYACSYRPGTNMLGKEEAKFVNQPQSSNTVPGAYNVVAGSSGIGVGSGSNGGNDTSLWQTFQDMESEIINTVGVGNIQELYATTNADGSVFQENGENYIIDATMSENYSLLEEYVKDIPTDALLSGGYDFLDGYVGGGDQFNVVRPDPPIQGLAVPQEHVYEEVLTFPNKQFQDSTAVKIDKPPTPTPVYEGTKPEEVFMNWLY